MNAEAVLILAWSDQLATGLADVDSQHRQLIGIINDLGSLRADGANGEKLRGVFDDLQSYTLYHFQTEADLMQSWPVNRASKLAHLKAHQSFIEYLEKARGLIATSPTDVTDHLLAFLVRWLVDHITGVDARMAAEIKALRCGVGPADTEKEPLYDALIDTVSDLYDNISVRTFDMLELNNRLQCEIEQRQRIEQELIVARDAAMASARVKSEFIANMSHEIRTPINGILGMIELACDTALTTEQREYMEFARSSAEGLLTIITDLLDFSKNEARKITLDHVSFDLRQALHNIAGPAALRARQKGLELRLEVDERLPRFILGDMPRLRQVILNLVGNALKFTEHGGIDIKVTLEKNTTDGVLVLFAIKDSGIGIASEKHDEIFEPFMQADTSISRSYGGTGLGLTICAMLVKLMDGQMRVESVAGEGSTFFFNAWFGHVADEQVCCTAQTTELVRQTRQHCAQHVLLVEDNPVNQKFALTVLRKAGHQTSLACNGNEALALVGVQHFDVILMDIQMPGMDGFAAARAIRRMGIDTPIIAMTAHAMAGLHEAILDSGMNDYLAKPVAAKTLLDKLDSPTPDAIVIPIQNPVLREMSNGVDAPVVDYDRAMRAVDGDTQHLKVLAQMVLEQLDGDIPVIRRHVVCQDTVPLKNMAHRLKGSLGSIAAGPAFAACQALDGFARDGVSAKYTMALAALEEQTDRLRPVLRAIAAGQFTDA